MDQSMQLVFQYFFTAGAGIGAGLFITAGMGYVAIKKLGGIKLWRNNKEQ